MAEILRVVGRIHRHEYLLIEEAWMYLLVQGLVDEPGSFRRKGAGVMGQQGMVHYAPPADRVPWLIQNLLDWLKQSEVHPLIGASVFHYEFEFIHPFEDGNGRMGRLWQTLILSRWNSLFADLPVESLVHARQPEYYAAINQSSESGDCAPFIEFMLERIHAVLMESVAAPTVAPTVNILLKLLKCHGELGNTAIREALGLKDRGHLHKTYLQPALEQGLIEMTLPEKPNSRLQQYRLTAKGRNLLTRLEQQS